MPDPGRRQPTRPFKLRYQGTRNLCRKGIYTKWLGCDNIWHSHFSFIRDVRTVGAMLDIRSVRWFFCFKSGLWSFASLMLWFHKVKKYRTFPSCLILALFLTLTPAAYPTSALQIVPFWYLECWWANRDSRSVKATARKKGISATVPIVSAPNRWLVLIFLCPIPEPVYRSQTSVFVFICDLVCWGVTVYTQPGIIFHRHIHKFKAHLYLFFLKFRCLK